MTLSITSGRLPQKVAKHKIGGKTLILPCGPSHGLAGYRRRRSKSRKRPRTVGYHLTHESSILALKPTKSVISKNPLSNTFRKLPLLKNGCPSTPSYPNTNSKKPGASQELTYYITGNGHYGSHSSHVLFSSLSRPRSDPVQGKDGGHFACCFPVGAYTTHPDRPGEWGRHRNRLRAGMPLLTLVLIAGFRGEDKLWDGVWEVAARLEPYVPTPMNDIKIRGLPRGAPGRILS